MLVDFHLFFSQPNRSDHALPENNFSESFPLPETNLWIRHSDNYKHYLKVLSAGISSTIFPIHCYATFYAGVSKKNNPELS
jgi:hypothetical protein